MICTIPPLITVIASPLILVCAPDTSAVLAPEALKALCALNSVFVPDSLHVLAALSIRSFALSIVMPLSSSVILLSFWSCKHDALGVFRQGDLVAGGGFNDR